MIEMASKQFIPAIIDYATNLADSINKIAGACPDADVTVQTDLLKKVSALLAEAQNKLTALKAKVAEAAEKEEGQEQALFFRQVVFTAMSELRAPIDELELLVSREYWPVPSYGELLFEV